MGRVILHVTIISLFFISCVQNYAVKPKVLANDVVSTCDQVIQMYSRVGYPVTDCIFMDKFLPYLYYRIDTKMTYQEARLACKTASNADLAYAAMSPDDQLNLNDLYRAKFLLNTWMWLGLERNQTTGSLQWIAGVGTPPPARWFPYADSTSNGDCGVMLILSDASGDKDKAGSFYYTEDCNNKYIAACQASVP